MVTIEFFYLIFWNVLISIAWFRTDWFVYYSQLFGLGEDLRLRYTKFISKNSRSYFPDFLYELSLKSSNRFKKFILKMVSCPMCLMFWTSLVGAFCINDIVLTAPLYVISLFIYLQIGNQT
jgi:hypothetical protein